MDQLAQVNRPKLLELLSERMTYERAGIKLYDDILAKMAAVAPDGMERIADQLRTIREQEIEHEQWLSAQIRLLGGDPDQITPRAQLVETEASGFEDVVEHDPELSHMMHALLMAELGDHAGWELLLELADFADDINARDAFAQRLHEEDRHLLFVQELVENMARREVLGQDHPMPDLLI